MAAKKNKKAVTKKPVSHSPCSCVEEPAAGLAHIQDWILILVGGLGLVSALGYLKLQAFDSIFPFVWSTLVIIIGIKNLMNKNC